MKLVRLAAVSAGLIAFAAPGFAQQKYPERPIRMIVMLPPGSSAHIAARLLQSPLEHALGQWIIIDNRFGANEIAAANAVATARPDGHTLLLAPATSAITAARRSKLPSDRLRALEPVAVAARSAQLVLVNPKVAANSLEEFVALAKANPGKINYSTPGVASKAHLLFDRWSAQTGMKMQHVPYHDDGLALLATVMGETHITLVSASLALPRIEDDAVRALATASTAREPQLPDVPTTAEAGYPKLQASQWIGLFATGGTPKAVVERLNAEINRALEDTALQARFTEHGLSVAHGTPEEFRMLIDSDIKKWQGAAKASHVETE